jgi:hypothetical protein
MEPDQLKMREQWLREELRAARTLLVSQMQWGMTVLAAVGLNLYYIRKDAKLHLVEQKLLKANELLPFFRWFIGTVFLLILASVFASAMRRVALHHRAYRTQLREMNPSYSGIVERIPVADNRFLNNTPYVLFFTIPCLDLVVWALFYAGEKLQLSFLIPW